MLKFTLKVAAILVLLMALVTMCSPPVSAVSEEYIRDRVVLLKGDKGLCSGIQVHTRLGSEYILSAAHCTAVTSTGEIDVMTAEGAHISRKILFEDPYSDLILLEPIPGLRGLDIARTSKPRQHVRTFTHGHGMPTYKTEGEIIADLTIQIPTFEIVTAADAAKCDKPKFRQITLDGIFFQSRACALDVEETATTAKIIPGSSGGVFVDDSGDIVGIASASDSTGMFGFTVRLIDIQRFLLLK